MPRLERWNVSEVLPDRPRVLLVDDEPLLLRALERLLRHLPVEIDTASSGEEALTLLERQRYELVVSDLVLMGISGVELLRRVRVGWPAVTCVLLTGQDLAQESHGVSGDGGYRVLSKPCPPAVLRQVVLDLLADSRRA